MTDEEFDGFYGAGMRERVRAIIADLAPTTRRDEWWADEAPYEIIACHLTDRDVSWRMDLAPSRPSVVDQRQHDDRGSKEDDR